MNKNGRQPISKRPRRNSFVAADDVFGNPLTLDDNLKKELADQGLAYRFVDAKRLYEMGGYHDKGWIPYKRTSKASDSIGLGEFKFGSDPEGIIRRGSLILAVKTAEQVAKHRAFLRVRADRGADFNHEKAEELKKFARDKGLGAEVYEGYEDNQQQEQD